MLSWKIVATFILVLGMVSVAPAGPETDAPTR